ncbi:MAG: PAS domain S-box protein [Vicinamibacterales bacterium]
MPAPSPHVQTAWVLGDVDDSAPTACTALEALGFAVTPRAWTRTTGRPPDLLVLCLGDGREVEAVRQVLDLTGSACAVVCIGAPPAVDRVRDSGLVEPLACLDRPVQAEDVVSAAQVALHARRLRRRSTRAAIEAAAGTHGVPDGLEAIRGQLRERESVLAGINANLVGTVVYRLVFTPDGRMHCPYISDSVVDLVGIPARAFTERAEVVFDIIVPEDLAGVREGIAASLLTDAPTSIDARVRTAAGELRWLQFRSRRTEILPDGGQVRDGVATDLTAIRLAEAALRDSEQRLEVTLASIGDGVLTTDVDGHVTRLNPVAEALTGWTQAEALGRPVADVFPIVDEGTRAPAVMPVDEVLATGRLHERGSHAALIARDGRAVPIADSAAPIRDGDGRVIGVVLVFRDETEVRAQRRLVDRQRRMLDGLRRVHERFIANPDGHDAFDDLLDVLVDSTGSACGCIDEVTREDAGALAMTTLAMSAGPAAALAGADADARRQVERMRDLLRDASATATPIVKGDRTADPPAAARGFRTFLALPVAVGGDVVGVVGVADRDGGYGATLVAELQPLVATARSLILARRADRRRRDAEAELRALNATLEERVEQRGRSLIAERRQADQELRRSHALLTATLEAATDGIVVTSREGPVTGFNEKFLALWPLDRADVERFDVDQLFDAAARSVEDAGAFLAAVRSAESEAGAQAVAEVTLQDGRHLEWYSQPQRVGDAVVGRVWSVRDVTERRRLERQVLRAQRMDAIGTLAGGIAHDLNNALAPITMAIQMLTLSNPGQADVLDTLASSAARASGMVRQLLTFAKGSDGGRTPIDTCQLVREIEKIVASTFPKSIRLTTRLPDAPTFVLGDHTQLDQVLLNLCVNARDALPHGGSLTIETAVETVPPIDAHEDQGAGLAPGAPAVVLRVTDSGTGIPAADLDRIFDPFYTTKPHEGTGLGLSTVLGIVKGHGGLVQVRSAPGAGSTFTVYLPPHAPDAPDAPRSVTPAARGGGELVLYVDDEAGVRRLAKKVLERLGFRAVTVADGNDALGALMDQRETIRLIITDLHMPRLGGLAFARAARKIAPEIPVVLASGRVEDKVLADFRDIGVTLVLEKPFSQQQMADILRIALGGQP